MHFKIYILAPLLHLHYTQKLLTCIFLIDKPTFPHPTTHIKQEIVWGYLNGTVNLTCVAVADPPATFEWYKHKDKIPKNARVTSQSPDVSILHLFIDDNHTFGDYKCVAKNTYGTLEKRFSLEKSVKPHPPKSVELTSTGSERVQLEIMGPELDATSTETTGFNVKYRILEKDWNERNFNVSTGTIVVFINYLFPILL